MQGVIGGRLQAYVRLPRPDALEVHHLSRYSKAWLAKLEALLGSPVEVVILTAADGSEDFSDWREAKWLVLNGAAIDGIPPMRNQDGRHLPSYLLPLDADDMEKLCFWARAEWRHLEIWMASGSLESETCRIVSSIGPAKDEDGLAQIGTWRKLHEDAHLPHAIKTADDDVSQGHETSLGGTRELMEQKWAGSQSKPV